MWKLSLPLVASFLLAFVNPAFAPPPQKPEKINVGPVIWSNDGFELQLSARFGQATAGEEAGFSISSTLDIRDASGATVTGLGPQIDPVEWREGAEPDREGFVPLVPQFFPWDRDGGTFTGDVTVLVTSKLLSPSGAMIDEPVRETFPVEVRE